MAEAADGLPQNQPRSIHALTVSPVCFKNRTGKDVELLWLDYEGKEVSKAELGPSQALNMNTYVTHPWIAKDKLSHRRMLMNFDRILYPQEPEVRRLNYQQRRALVVRIVVLITQPLYSLEELCRQVVQSLVSVECMDQLPLPKEVIKNLSSSQEE